MIKYYIPVNGIYLECTRLMYSNYCSSKTDIIGSYYISTHAAHVMGKLQPKCYTIYKEPLVDFPRSFTRVISRHSTYKLAVNKLKTLVKHGLS